MASRKKAFTLVELLAVIAIIGILAGLILTGVEISIKRAKVTRTRAAIDGLGVALSNFERDMGSFDVEVGPEGGTKVQMPIGIIKQSESDKRIKLVRILSGKELKDDGTFRNDADIRRDPMWNGPYLDPKLRELQPKNPVNYTHNFKKYPGQLVDGWSNPLMIRIKQENFDKQLQHRPDSFEIYSWGPDEKDDGGEGDDINNWE